MFDALVSDLKNINGVTIQEYEFKTRPNSNHGTIQIEFILYVFPADFKIVS